MKKFLEFIREQGVIGLAVGFILGGAVSQLVAAVVTDLVNPFIGLLIGSVKGLEKAYFPLFGAKVLYGHFLSVLVNFVVVAAVVYGLVRILRLDRLDKKK